MVPTLAELGKVGLNWFTDTIPSGIRLKIGCPPWSLETTLLFKEFKLTVVFNEAWRLANVITESISKSSG